MKTIGLAAIIALTSTAAFAGSFQFSIGGGTARIDYDEDCTDRLCASVSWQEHGSRDRMKFRLPEVSTKTISKYIDVPKPQWNSSPPGDDENDETADTAEPSSKPSPAPSAGESQTTERERDEPASVRQAEREPPAKVEAQAPAPRPSTRVAAPTPSTDVKPASKPAPAPSAGSAPADESAPAASVAPDPAPTRTKVANVAPKSEVEKVARPSRPTPVGEWLVEDGEGKIRIEECGANMCGYVSEAKNPNEKDRHNPNPALRSRSVIGTPILINMQPNGKRWSGRIYNVKDGRSYTAHISLKSADTLRVEGCAFGGMICGGQNWSRVN
ncbi:MAG: DUF2147 domain-containing protein [Xanthobacteraceae bacterium]